MTKGEETRQFIIERSAAIFNTKGIAATPMSDVMEATRLAKGSLYVHFDNKESLAEEVVEYNLKALSQKVVTAISGACTAREKLFAYIDVLTDVSNPPVKGGCPMINFGMEADDTNAAIRKRIDRAMDSAQQLIAEVIRQGIKDGEFRATWNYREFAVIMFAMIEGGIVIGRVAGSNAKVRTIAKHLKEMISAQLA